MKTKNLQSFSYKSLIFFTIFLIFFDLPSLVSSECSCDIVEENIKEGEIKALIKYKLGSIGSILIAGALGVCLPIFGSKISFLNPENDIFFMIKAFAAGVILGTAFIHILPDAFATLNSPCLDEDPWRKFPFTGFVAMLSAIGTLMVDSFASGYYKRQHFSHAKPKQVGDEEIGEEHAGHVHVHTHATHGHTHGAGASVASPSENLDMTDLIRHRIISQVLELGIVVHSVVIGLSLGTSQSVDTIKPLLVALSFHQFFEGMGLGGCISQAKFKFGSTVIMAVFFSLTTPLGIAIGMGISSSYQENSPKALIVGGLLNSGSAGILIYMSLVDLLAADFMSLRLQTNLRLQLGANLSLLLGAACMSALAKWA